MKKKVIAGCFLITALLLVCGVYTVATVERATGRLSSLIELHRVEMLRENLLLKIRRVQYDISLKNTKFGPSFDLMVRDVREMQRSARVCFSCHHEEEVRAELLRIGSLVEEYKKRISRILTYSANIERIQKEMDEAFHVGSSLSKSVEEIISRAGDRLKTQTRVTMGEIRRAKVIVFSLLGVGFLIIAFVSFSIVKSVTDPLQALLGGIKRLKKGDLDYRVEGLKDEFGEVASAFNEMAASLKEQISQIQRAEQLAVFGKFAAKLAHEIKNPLAGIKVAVDVLSEGEGISGEDKEILAKVSGEISRIELLLKSLLGFSRPPKPMKTCVDVNRVLELALSFALKGSRVADGRLEVEKKFDHSIPPVFADPKQLEQVFLNIFLNALEAMPEGGVLTVSTEWDEGGEEIVVVISDTGEGIDEEKVEKIFQPFFTTKPKGTGLGLAISRQLVEQNDGSIEVSSARGEGTSFCMRFKPATETGEEPNGKDPVTG